MISCKKCEYAIRALVDLAQTQSRTGAREISQRQNVPYHFVAKILQELKVKGFLRSARGAGGGFALTRPADQIRQSRLLFTNLSAADSQVLVNALSFLLNRFLEGMCSLLAGKMLALRY